MQRDIGDILDRRSIAKLKRERIGTPENVRELEAFDIEFQNLKNKYPTYDWEQFAKMLYDVNDSIWRLEAGLKSGKEQLKVPHYLFDIENKESLASIGIIAILIRNYNKLRVDFKNIINNLLGTGFIDVKMNHLSEEEC